MSRTSPALTRTRAVSPLSILGGAASAARASAGRARATADRIFFTIPPVGAWRRAGATCASRVQHACRAGMRPVDGQPIRTLPATGAGNAVEPCIGLAGGRRHRGVRARAAGSSCRHGMHGPGLRVGCPVPPMPGILAPVAAHHSVAGLGLPGASGSWPWVAAGLGAVAIAALLLWLRASARRRARPARRGVAPRYPVVLAHGLLGFDQIRIGGARHDYFRGVSERLVREGCAVHRSRVAATASIAARAADLAAFVEGLDARYVNVVAHSMGGLDARYALARLGMRRKVVSLVTIGTPHRGTPLADAGASLAARAGLFFALRRVGVDVQAFHDLTVARMAAFDKGAPDVRGVHYACVIGAPGRKRDVSPILVPTFAWLRDVAGPNDGMVPADSQRWGEVLKVVPADHFAQIGWTRRFDALDLYADLLRELRGRGL